MKQGQIIYCPYCGRQAEYVDTKEIYGKSYGMAYLCRPCDAYVGVHDGTDQPLGSLANWELRRWRNRAHAAFDPLWQRGRFRRRRNDAYAWLAEKMGLPKEETHIAMFNVPQCKQVIQIMNDERRQSNEYC